MLAACASVPPTGTVLKGKYHVTASGEFDLEREPLEAPEPGVEVAAANAGDVFRGTARRAAKTSIATANMETFASIVALRATLDPDSTMRHLDPPITTAASSDRTDRETRNVTVSTFIYAIKKEEDRDFHIIVGDDACTSPSCFLNVEVSGWPKSPQHPDRPKLKQVRADFLQFFSDSEPGTSSGYDKFDPPIPVELQGSLFFDVDHAAGSIGPTCCRPSTAWEIHPITKVVFEPPQP